MNQVPSKEKYLRDIVSAHHRCPTYIPSLCVIDSGIGAEDPKAWDPSVTTNNKTVVQA